MRYNEESRELQARFDTQRLADRIAERLVKDHIDAADRAFIEARDMFFLATADAEGAPQCSYKGGDPGFVRVLDERTLQFPNYDGNGMFLSAGNALQNPRVGLLFIDFQNRRRLRLSGKVLALEDEAAPSEHPGAEFLWTIAVEEVFPNCSRYIHEYRLVQRSEFVPQAACTAPIPDWKRRDWARDVLPAKDPANESNE
jgi:predicted pyridoxine 5'-phosphate oxidase superfamily flavin-nucleotide-binding protein